MKVREPYVRGCPGCDPKVNRLARRIRRRREHRAWQKEWAPQKY